MSALTVQDNDGLIFSKTLTAVIVMFYHIPVFFKKVMPEDEEHAQRMLPNMLVNHIRTISDEARHKEW